ncbi:ATP-dependent dethiobiotin synthetase BioD [Buchnera aphidicola (Neophyllaphis podocarpi)]|uniref:dethiobiotin synthase n=1 Tax=Buchnera aphidicola TaxID=9 RepID=UPI003464CA4D
MIKRWFVTGTDTSVGKTVAVCILLKIAHKKGYKAVGYKPIASGSAILCKNNKLILNKDALMIQNHSSIKLSHKEINPIFFEEQAPPHILNKKNKYKISMSNLSIGLKKISKKSNFLLIEGAGGWYTPLSNKNKFSDWVKKEKLSVIIVVNLKIGCINHTILTYKAIISSNLNVSGWIANNVKKPSIYCQDYINTINYMLKIPFLGEIPYSKNLKHLFYKNDLIKLPQN